LFKKKNGDFGSAFLICLKRKYFSQQNSFPSTAYPPAGLQPCTLRHADIHLQSHNFAGKNQKRMPGVIPAVPRRQRRRCGSRVVERQTLKTGKESLNEFK